jgi:uncharacterized protein
MTSHAASERRRQTPRASAPFLVVSVHDVSPATATAVRRWASALSDLSGATGPPVTWLVIPGPWRGRCWGDPGDDGRDLVPWLRSRQDRGDEISLHGWCHRSDACGPPVRLALGRAPARGAAELWTADRTTSAARARAGLDLLRRHGFRVTGSTPPGWLASREARAGLRDAGLQYVTDHAGVVDLRTGRRLPAPALCNRPAVPHSPAQGPSPASHLAEGAGMAVLRTAPLLVRAGPSVRIGLHPADLDSPRATRAALAALRGRLRAGANPTTYAVLARPLGEG